MKAAAPITRVRRPESRVPGSGVRGFTLIEVLLALTLLALIMTLAYQGLSTGARISAGGQAAIERTNQIRIVQTFLRHQLSQAKPMPFDADETLGQVVFEGGEQVLRFVGPMPGYLSFGGAYVQTLALVQGDNGQALVFKHKVMQYGGEAEQNDNALEEREPVVLLAGIDDAAFSYLKPPESVDGDPSWVSEWQDVSRLPMMVKLEIEMEEAARIHWPAFQVALKVDATGDERPQLFQFGPLPGGDRR